MTMIPDAVQPPAWADALPRPWYRGREVVKTAQPWFDVYALPCGGFAIYEPGHFQEVISFLLPGSERALLWDTGMGMGDMYALVRELTALPIIAVNSHTHFDHMGGNHQFDRVWAFEHPAAKARVENGLSIEAVAEHTTADQFSRPLPEGFDPVQYRIRGAVYNPMNDGNIFDLGGRRLRVLHTPGHSPDSVMLLDEDNGILLTGDTFYPATLYSHLDAGGGMKSRFAQYGRTMKHLTQEMGDVRTLYCSHNEPIVDAKALGEAAKAFANIAMGAADYQTDESGLRLYRFDGFAIVADPKDITDI